MNELCIGQIELYTHSDIMGHIVDIFKGADYKVCALYCLESLFLQDVTKFFAGVLTATSAMLQLGIPHLNLITKTDLLGLTDQNEEEESYYDDELSDFYRYLCPDPTLLEERLSCSTSSKFYRLNKALVQLIDEYDMVNFMPVNIRNDTCLQKLMIEIDFATQFSEAVEPKEPDSE